MIRPLEGKKVVLGVSGGIAAYKAVELTRLLVKEGAQVYVVMTESAKQFITPLTFEALSGHPVYPRDIRGRSFRFDGTHSCGRECRYYGCCTCYG